MECKHAGTARAVPPILKNPWQPRHLTLFTLPRLDSPDQYFLKYWKTIPTLIAGYLGVSSLISCLMVSALGHCVLRQAQVQPRPRKSIYAALCALIMLARFPRHFLLARVLMQVACATVHSRGGITLGNLGEESDLRESAGFPASASICMHCLRVCK